MENTGKTAIDIKGEDQDVDRFAESYAAFSRTINSLQRKYIELKDEFTAQNEQLVEANRKLLELSERNLEATEFLDGILNSLSAGVIAVDADGRITHFNPASARILGLSQGQVLGEPYRDVIQPGSLPHASALRTAESGQAVDSVEKSIDLEDGRRLWLSVSTATLNGADGELVGAVEVFQDQTQIKKMEREFSRLNTLAAMGEMAATIAHQVRNPLNGIAGFASLLERDLEEDDPRHATASKIVQGVETLNKTVATLLNYTRYEETNKSEVPLLRFVQESVGRFSSDGRRDLQKVSVDVASEGDRIESSRLSADPVLLREVFGNILQNAAEAMDFDGDINVTVRGPLQSREVSPHAERILLGGEESIVEVVIADTGPGLKEHDRERVFSPFFSTRSGGNGLGLAVVWKIVKAHGGEVYVDSADSGGAAFHVLLPARCEDQTREQ